MEGLGVSLPSHDVLGAVRDSKIASSLTRKLMGLLFTNEEMARSSVWGKTKKPLDRQKIEAIIGYNLEFLCILMHTYFFNTGFAIRKYPNTISEYPIHQADEKLHVERKKYHQCNA